MLGWSGGQRLGGGGNTGTIPGKVLYNVLKWKTCISLNQQNSSLNEL